MTTVGSVKWKVCILILSTKLDGIPYSAVVFDNLSDRRLRDSSLWTTVCCIEVNRNSVYGKWFRHCLRYRGVEKLHTRESRYSGTTDSGADSSV